jgi:predicted small lipoprotein YifL
MRKRTALRMLLAAAAILALGGCGKTGEPTGPDDNLVTRTQTANIDDPFGGYNFADEAPGFGDPALIEEFGEDPLFSDPFANDPLVAAREIDRDGRPRGRVYLAVTWGNLQHDSTITDATDWTGSLSVKPGIILLERTIRFEPRDYILPRTDRGLLEWVSRTSGGFDGVLVRIVPCPSSAADVQSEIDSANTVITFSTGPFTASFTLADLPGLHRIVTLDDGNTVSFDAITVPPLSCPRGFLSGAWGYRPDRERGEFFGKYMSESGVHMGFVKGFYGVNKNGERVFFGKWIGRAGEFRGILRGAWDADESGEAGTFRGGWMGRDRRFHGDLKGEWRRRDDRHEGFFRGVWAMDCADKR